MATRGAKPKPAALRLVEGTHNVTRHGKPVDAEVAAEGSADAFGSLVQPTGLRGECLKAWKRYIKPAWWLDGSKEPAALAFCELWQEFRASPSAFQAAKHGQMRAYMAELGLTDERNRTAPERKAKDEFDD